MNDSPRWLQYLIKRNLLEMESPLTYETAMAFKKETGVIVRYKGPDNNWTTSTKLPGFDEIDYEVSGGDISVQFVIKIPHAYVLITRKDELLLCATESEMAVVNAYFRNAGILIVAISLSWVTALYVLYRLLRPLRYISEGVEQVSTGRFHYRLPVVSRDEFGDISKQFNRMTQQIEQMLQSRKQLLLNVSHDLRTPLARMRLSLAVISDCPEKADIEVDIVEIDQMLGKLMDSARLDNPAMRLHKESVNLSKLIGPILKKNRNQNPGIRFHEPKKALFVNVDPFEIQVVLNNLIDNALKYSAHQSQPVQISVERTNEAVYIRIEDHGIGIPKQDVPLLFEPFYRVDKSRSSKIDGYGLGLSICKQIITAHGGTISISSQENRYTILTVCLPN